MILVAQLLASSKFLTAIGLSSPILFILFWAITFLYTAQGGLKAVIATDMVQAAFFFLVFVSVFVWIVSQQPPLFDSPLAVFPPSPVATKIWGWLLLPLLFMVIEQDMGQRCFAGNSPKVVSRASFWAGISTLLICIIPVFLGRLAKISGIAITPGSSVLLAVVAAKTNPLWTAFVGCAVLAAIVSTATSLINAMNSNLAQDFKWKRGKQSLKSLQWMTGGIALAAIIFAFYFQNIVDLLLQSYALSVSCLCVPIGFALMRDPQKPSPAPLAAWCSLLAGGLAFVTFQIIPPPFPCEIGSLLISLLGYGGGNLVQRYFPQQA